MVPLRGRSGGSLCCAGGRRGWTIVQAATGGVTRSFGYEARVPARRKPTCRGGSRRRSAHTGSMGLRLCLAVLKVELRSPDVLVRIASAGDRSAVERRNISNANQSRFAIEAWMLPLELIVRQGQLRRSAFLVNYSFQSRRAIARSPLCFNRERFVTYLCRAKSDGLFRALESRVSASTHPKRSGDHQ